MGFLDRLRGKAKDSRLARSLSRTRETLSENVHRVLGGRNRLDDDAMEELEEVLLAGDVGVGATEALLERLRERARAGDAGEGDLEDVLAEEVTRILQGHAAPGAGPPASTESPRPRVVLLVGVNGTGKTTTLGKLARHHRERGERVVVGAADTFRAAAVEQLRIWAERADVEIVAGQPGADPASIAYDAVAAAQAREADVVLIDTAGRLQTKVNLMEELAKIARVVAKRIPDAPHEVLLVLDATTGQNALSQARQFGKATPVTGLVLTKLDGTAKGGVVVAIAQELGIPVRFLGLGEGIGDLAPFEAESFAAALFARD
jgi:fused signal recognition particle receptor